MNTAVSDAAIPDPVREATKALFRALGAPVTDQTWAGDYGARIGCHPVFGLAEHYRGHDGGARGYTDNPYRGDHMSIPGYTEDGNVFVLDVSFHKGDTHIERIDFPGGPADVRSALHELLISCETR
ncbi:hypothetical protein [Rhodococcus wratislaviensis]|uniref:Uncharacterized protein n=1 Tax=Rhodococcus wratislaviensis NBRC 100605 TaxID=1219028 RepID=X0Q386_RHOWR|nr:hypothetical protein [Rhodococcus wratislaviensis]GAF45497.1 hypothetical protein RW1_022_00750 [Rhodococcus wratislaviensis NBRC 100605]